MFKCMSRFYSGLSGTKSFILEDGGKKLASLRSFLFRGRSLSLPEAVVLVTLDKCLIFSADLMNFASLHTSVAFPFFFLKWRGVSTLLSCYLSLLFGVIWRSFEIGCGLQELQREGADSIRGNAEHVQERIFYYKGRVQRFVSPICQKQRKMTTNGGSGDTS